MNRLLMQLRSFRARARLVMPRHDRPSTMRVYPSKAVPKAVFREFDLGGPILEPYAELSRAWHSHAAAFVPQYGPYAGSLIETGALRSEAALDLACGTGIQSMALAPLFRKVYALDCSPHMLMRAKEILGAHENVEVVEAEFGAFSLAERVDLVVSSGDSLNYVRSISELETVFGCVAEALRRGGLFVFDLQNERSFRALGGAVFHFRMADFEWLQVHAYDPKTRVDDAHTITRLGVEHHRRISISAAEVRAAAQRAGLHSCEVFDNPVLRYLAALGRRDFYAFRRGA